MVVEISKNLLLVKAHYFMFFGGTACAMGFLPVMINQMGVSYTMLGYVNLALPFSGLVVKPLFGALTDRLRNHRFMLVVSLAATACFYFGMNFLPDVNPMVAVEAPSFSCSNDTTSVFVCGNFGECSRVKRHFIGPVCSLKCNFATLPVPTNCSLGDQPCWEQNMTAANNELFFLEEQVFSISSSFNKSCATFLSSHGESVDVNLNGSVCQENLKCVSTCKCSGHKDTEIYSSTSFIVLIVLMLLAYNSFSVCVVLTDTMVMDLVIKKNGDFGIQRLWGTIGWGLLALVTGVLNKWASKDQDRTNFSPGFYMLFCILLANCIVAYFIKVIPHSRPKQMLKQVVALYRDPLLVVFTFAVIVMGIMTGALWTFLVVYLMDLGGSLEITGFAMAVQCFGGELPLFLLSGFIIKKLGHIHSMTLCLASYGLRFMAYSYLTNPWHVLPIELMNGLTFGLFFATLVTFAKEKAPVGMLTTMQAVFQSCFEGIGTGLGSWVSGILYESYGGSALFRIMGTMSAVTCILYALSMLIMGRCHSGHAKTPVSCEVDTEMEKKHAAKLSEPEENHNFDSKT